MKKILALVLALAMMFTLAACGGDEPVSSAPADEPTSSTPASTPEEPEQPEEPVADYSKAGTYKYYEDKGDMGIMVWDIELGADGSCTLIEHNTFIGDQVKVCDGWVDNGDGTITTGAWESTDGPKPDFIEEDGSCTWEVLEGGILQPVNGPASVDPSLAEPAESIAGTYKYYEDKGDMGIMVWDIELNDDGSCTLIEHNTFIGDQIKVCDGWKDNGDGTFFTGAWESTDGPKPDFIEEDGSCTWEIVGDGICQPVNGPASVDPSLAEPAESIAGTYKYYEDKGDMGIMEWDSELNADGTCTLIEHNTFIGDQVKVCDGWKDNGDGTFFTGAWESTDGPKPDFIEEDGSCTWEILEGGLCQPVNGPACVDPATLEG